MRTHHYTRLGRFVVAASGIALMVSGISSAPAMAQTVRVFDDAPSIEQLRSIMIPESVPGLSRTIVIQRPDTGGPSPNVQRASTQAMPAMRQPVEATEAASPAAEKVAAAAPARPAAVNAPATKVSAAVKTGTVGMRINFGFNSAILPESAHAMIDRVAQVMKEAPDIKVRVEGHTDAIGGADYNVALSERRALSVGAYLVKLGIDPSRLMLVGKGMAEPLSDNPNDAANRRVQFVRVG